jgi:hypothetical protein
MYLCIFPISLDICFSPPSLERISQFVSLVTAACPPIAPPAAILGLAYIYVEWLAKTVLENMCVSLGVYYLDVLIKYV